MEPTDIEDAAMFLLHLRLHRNRAAGMAHELTPKTLDQAYAIQDAVHRFAGWPLGVLKVGCTSQAAQTALSIPHPIAGRVPVEGVFDDGATVPRSFLGAAPLLECEIALRIGEGGEVDAVAPAIELVDPRFQNLARLPGLGLVADNSGAAATVIGPAADPSAVDVSALDVRLLADGREIATGSTTDIIGGPYGSLQWALDHEAQRGRTVAPGTWVITGTCTGLTPADWGTTYTAEFGPLGSVHFTLGERS